MISNLSAQIVESMNAQVFNFHAMVSGCLILTGVGFACSILLLKPHQEIYSFIEGFVWNVFVLSWRKIQHIHYITWWLYYITGKLLQYQAIITLRGNYYIIGCKRSWNAVKHMQQSGRWRTRSGRYAMRGPGGRKETLPSRDRWSCHTITELCASYRAVNCVSQTTKSRAMDP